LLTTQLRAAAERALLAGSERRDLIEHLAPALDATRFTQLQVAARKVHVAPALLDYVQAIIGHTRRSSDFVIGLSPRAGLSLLNAARAWTFLDDRGAVLPEDVQAVLPSVDLDPVTPGAHGDAGGSAEARHNGGDVGRLHPLRHLARVHLGHA
jgi:MoxR-like ATPase